MRRCVLDTDIFSEVLKGIDANVAANAAAYQARFGVYTTSMISVMEVVKGLHKVGREQKILEFLNKLPAVEVLTLDIESAALSGRIYADLERAGQTIGRADPLIAGIALRHGLCLVTGNQSHYQRVREMGYDLELENWRGK